MLAVVATLAGYAILDGNRLTPRSAFITLFLFDLIRYSLFAVPHLIVVSVKSMISLRRILRFLHEEERAPSYIEALNDDDNYAGE